MSEEDCSEQVEGAIGGLLTEADNTQDSIDILIENSAEKVDRDGSGDEAGSSQDNSDMFIENLAEEVNGGCSGVKNGANENEDENTDGLKVNSAEQVEGAVGGILDNAEQYIESNLYKDLVELHHENINYYYGEFDCPICLEHMEGNSLEGIILKECLHVFCRDCLIKHITSSAIVDIHCPYINEDYSCNCLILESEIQEVLSGEQYAERLEKTLAYAASTITNAVHCKVPDCKGWIINGEPEFTTFVCPCCNKANCIPCQDEHDGLTCEQYTDIKVYGSQNAAEAKKSEVALKNLIIAGEAMICPHCTAIVEKISGCDWVICSVCKTSLCWATKKRRWGPKGPGDDSDGCRCMVNGVRCHPKCQNCH